MKSKEIMDIRCEKKKIKECPSGKQQIKVSHWAKFRHRKPIQFLWNRRIFFWIFSKKAGASLTIEAACVLPVFFIALCTMVSVLDCYRIQSVVKTSLHQSAMELGMYAYMENDMENNALNTILCTSYAQNKLPKLEENVSVSMVGSSYRDHRIRLTAAINYELWFSIFPISMVKMVNVSEVYSWVGQSSSDLDDADSVYSMVYVAEHESVYHISASCSHIDRQIYQKKKKGLQGTYVACETCCKGKEITGNDVVYYTKTGYCYHVQRDCSSLKRTIRVVALHQVGDLSLCERCRKRET